MEVPNFFEVKHEEKECRLLPLDPKFLRASLQDASKSSRIEGLMGILPCRIIPTGQLHVASAPGESIWD